MDHAPKTTNNILVCLSVVLKTAVAWKRISAMPCSIKLVKVPENIKPDIYDDDQLSRLVAAASSRTSDLVTVLLGADAGLRRGEAIGLGWDDIDLQRGTLTVRRAVYRGVVGTPKGNAERTIDLTPRLKAALQAHKPAEVYELASQKPLDTNARVLVGASDESIRSTMERLSRRAGLPAGTRMKRGKEVPRWLGLYHKLRHTFCSRLAARNVPLLSIKKVAGHKNIATTMRYLHPSEDATKQAIQALERPAVGSWLAAESGAAGNMKETAK